MVFPSGSTFHAEREISAQCLENDIAPRVVTLPAVCFVSSPISCLDAAAYGQQDDAETVILFLSRFLVHLHNDIEVEDKILAESRNTPDSYSLHQTTTRQSSSAGRSCQR